MYVLAYFYVVLPILFHSCICQLVVNVKNKGDEILQESIHANTSQDTITLQFVKSDGTQVTQFIDFKNEVQIFRSVILGEEELGQPHYQVTCHVLRLGKNEFISSDAMSKLRQKNPNAIRNPEEDKGEEVYTMDLSVDVDRASISPYISKLCDEARHSTNARDADLKALAKTLPHKDYTSMLGLTKMTNAVGVATCRSSLELLHPCICRYQLCVGWYPCGLKYCHGKDSSGKVVNYRCGIKTCHKCRTFDYHVPQRNLCMWDLPD